MDSNACPSVGSPTAAENPTIMDSPEGFLTIALTTQRDSLSNSVYPLPLSLEPNSRLPRIKISEIFPVDGAATLGYMKTVEDLWGSLAKHGAAIVELSIEDAALLRCALESAKVYFRTRTPCSSSPPPSPKPISKFIGFIGSTVKEMYYYRAGRNMLGEGEQQPPCLTEVYQCLGKASRAVLGAICRHFQLRSDTFCSLLDDCPLPRNDTSSSVLLATHYRNSAPMASNVQVVEKGPQELEKGLITLVASDSPGLQVCDSNGLWYVADIGIRVGDLLLLTGRSLQHITAGLCKAHPYRIMPLSSSNIPDSTKRVSLMFRLMPHGKAVLDGSVMAGSGYRDSESYGPVRASKFLESLSSQEVEEGISIEKVEIKRQLGSDSTLRTLLSDPLTGDLLEDAVTAAGCGHSFGSGTLKRVRETGACTSCGKAVKTETMIPNLVLRAVAVAFDREEKRRRAQVVSRKRKKELQKQRERKKRLKESKGPRKILYISEQAKGLQFNINEKVLIKGNKRTPEKLVGKEAFVTSKCLNGWYLLKLAENGESVRLQFRSLEGMAGIAGGSGDSTQKQNSENLEG